MTRDPMLPKKWQPCHFPIGTLVEIDTTHCDYIRKTNPDGVIEITGIEQNGIDSYIIKSNIPSAIEDITFGINTHFVKRIVKRGNGLTYYEMRRNLIPEQRTGIGHCSISIMESSILTKNTFQAFSKDYFITFVLAKLLVNHNMIGTIDYDKLLAEINKHVSNASFIRKIYFLDEEKTAKISSYERYYKAGKKKLSKIVKRAINKGLVNKKQQIKVEHKMYAEDEQYDIEPDIIDRW